MSSPFGFRTSLSLQLLVLLIFPVSVLLNQQRTPGSLATPEILSVTPDSPRLEGGTEITITGKNCPHDAVVILGDAQATSIWVESDSKIRFLVPPQKYPGKRTLSVRTKEGMAQRKFVIQPRPFSEISAGEIT